MTGDDGVCRCSGVGATGLTVIVRGLFGENVLELGRVPRVGVTARWPRIETATASSSCRWTEEPTNEGVKTAMADDRMALIETLRKATAGGDVDVLREGVRVLAQAIVVVTQLTL